ncbi:MAG: hypothetical protein ABIS51_07525 [Sphingomonas sp.]
MDDPPSFLVASHKSIVSADLGDQGVRVWLIGDTLVLIGKDQVRLDLPVASIERMRVGVYDNRFSGKCYQMILWSPELSGPITLETVKSTQPAFTQIVRAVSAAMDARPAPGTIERGLTWLTALSFPLWMLGAGLIITLIEIAKASQDKPGESPLVVIGMSAAIYLPIAGLLFGLFTWRYMPRTLASAGELEPYLPAGEG